MAAHIITLHYKLQIICEDN